MTPFILMVLLTIPSDVKVLTLDGQTQAGRLKSISETEIVVASEAADITVAVNDVMAIDFPENASDLPSEDQQLTLVDGSQLHGMKTVRSARELTIQSRGLGPLTIENKAIQAVRLQADNPVFRSQWNTFQKRDTDKDLLIVAKRDGSGLDFLPGVVSSISSEKIDFLLDGDTVPVPSARVYGVVFARPASPAKPLSGASVKISTVQGDLISARTIIVEGNSLRLETAWGQTLATDLSQIRKIDLSGGRIQFLSDLEPIEETFDGVDPEGSFFTGLIDREQQLTLFGPRRDSTMERQSRIRLRGREYSKGLCLHSKTKITWAIDGQYSSLDCIAGIDDTVAFNGKHSVALKIIGDSNVLFDQLVSTTDGPLPLHLPLEGVSTLTVIVDFGDGDSTCDWLDLADAKLVIAKPATP